MASALLDDGILMSSLPAGLLSAQLSRASRSAAPGGRSREQTAAAVADLHPKPSVDVPVGRDDKDSEVDDDEDNPREGGEGGEGGEEDDDNVHHAADMLAAPLDPSQKKRADYHAFDSWLAENRESIAQTTKETVGDVDDDDKTAATLVREFESTKIIESPRDYQIELFEKAKQKNIIAVLDTGSGKTLIAALLLRHTVEQELEDRAHGRPHRVAFFLVDKVALVFQQHAVLECNLGQPVAKFSGERADLRWSSRDFWDKTLAAHMVVVCTADILLKCLHHSYVRMDQISLLVFDEAHHTKKNHAYARIIKDFYPRTDGPECAAAGLVRRPRIFGMTASPVDARTNVAQAAQELEALLQSEIATVAHNALLHDVTKPKKERVVFYHTALRPAETELTERLRLLVGSHRFFAKHFHFALENLVTLGPWIVDRFWHILFRQEELAKHEAKAEIDDPYGGLLSDNGDTKANDGSASGDDSAVTATASPVLGEAVEDGLVEYSASVAAVREAGRIVQQHTLVPPAMALLSNKVQRLHEILFDEFTKLHGSNTRCIVFVQQRYAAVLLADLFQHPPMTVPGLRTGILVGGASSDVGKNSFRTQLLTLSKFKRGQVNCLFATSVAEEGLDIPDCNLVVRFDLYRTMIQYIQSRGRARHHESMYVHMAELGNLDHSRLLAENKACEAKMRDFCNALPADRKLGGNDYDMDYFLREETSQPSFQVPSTKAKLTYRSSLGILAQYVSTLPEPTDGALRAEFSVFYTADGFVCEVSLPSSSPIRHATGRPHRRKQIAKCAAAFAMCLQLYEKKYIDKHLYPVFASKLPAMRNARLAVSSKKQAQYTMRLKPAAWSALGTPPQLFATLLLLRSPEALGRASHPLVLLTRVAMPAVPEFPLFFGSNRTSHVRCVPLDVPMQPSPDELSLLTAFTLRAFRDVFSKEYDGSAADMPYYLAPCNLRRHGLDHDTNGRDARTIVDWAAVHLVAQTGDKVPCSGDEPDEFFGDRFVSDPFDGSRKFYLRRVRRDLSPLDPVPDDVPPPKQRAWSRPTTVRNILNYSVSLWAKSRARCNFRDDQPVVEAELVVQRRNLLDERVHLDDPKPNRCFLVLDTLRISPIPVETVAMLFSFPPIIHRLESALIAMEAADVLGLSDLRPELALEAVTKDCDASDDYKDIAEGPINFQAGMGKNYERLELLGDSFLKMASTIALYTLVPDKNEFEYHVQRMCIICNKNLFNNALDMGLEEYIRSKAFDRSWYPPVVNADDKKPPMDGDPASAASSPAVPFGLVLKKGKRQSPRGDHALSDKSIADVCEAMIGAAYLTTYDARNFDLAVRAVSAVAKSKLHPMQAYADYFAAYVPPDWQTAPATAAQVHLAKTVAETVGYTFRYPRLLRCAFTHPSYPRIYENLPSYQRLEFLGDALFDMAAVDYLFHKYPDKDPQWLTEHKMAMVSNQFLGALAVSLGFHRHLLSFTGDLQKQVLEYVVKIEDARARAEAEAVQAGLPRSAFAHDYWVHVARPVKVLADVLEAYIGAVFVDAGYDYWGAVVPLFQRHVQPYFEDMALYDTFANKHPVTFAVRLLSQRFGCRDWRVVVQETPDNAADGAVTFATKVAAGFLVHGRVVGHGLAESGRYAKIAAAKQALGKLDSLGVEAFRALTGCSCGAEAEEEEAAEAAAAAAEGLGGPDSRQAIPSTAA